MPSDPRRASTLGALCVGAFLWTSAHGEVRIESAMGVDSNVRRTESETPVSDGFIRLVVAADTRTRLSRRCALGARYHGGARHFSTHDEEDTLVQRAEAQMGCKLDWARVSLAGQVRDRFTRRPAHPRDFAHAAVRLPTRLLRGDFSLTVSPSVGRFHFKPNGRYSATELGARLGLDWRTPRWQAGLDGGYTQRRFGGPPISGSATDVDRVDDRLRFGARVRYLGGWVGELSGAVVTNDSPEPSGGYRRQELALSATVGLGFGVLGSSKLTVIRILHDQVLRLPDDLLLDDEGRTALTFRLEKPIDPHWSIVFHGGYWTSPFDTGPEYERVQGILGVSHR